MSADNFEVSGFVNPKTGKFQLFTGNDTSESINLVLNFGLEDGPARGGGRFNISLGGADKLVDGTRDENNNEFFDDYGRMLTMNRTTDELVLILDDLILGDGIAGCSYSICADDTVMLAFDSGTAMDFLTVSGQYIEDYFDLLPDGYRVAANNSTSQFEFVDFAAGFSIAMGGDPDASDPGVNSLVSVVGSRFTEDELEEVLDLLAAGEMDKTNYYVCETEDVDTSTLVLLAEGNHPSVDTVDTIVFENVDNDIIPLELLPEPEVPLV